MQKTQKKEIVDRLHDLFAGTNLVVVATYKGMTVAETTDLRRQMRAAGAGLKVTKNRLAKRALDGTQYDNIVSMFTGQTAIAYSEDPVAAAKIAVGFAKKNEKFVVLGGAMGETVLDADAVRTLAEIPSLDELRGKLVGLLQAPATKIAGVLAAPAGQLARVLNAHATKGEAA